MWLKGGDSNTKYFHKKTKIQKSFNAIKDLKDKYGNMIKGKEELKGHSFTHFQYLYSKNGETYSESQMNLHPSIPLLINSIENRDIAKPIMEYEIRNAIWSLHADKAPVPDGFTINFYIAKWDIIKEDLKKMLNWTRKKDKISGATNSSFLALIPK